MESQKSSSLGIAPGRPARGAAGAADAAIPTHTTDRPAVVAGNRTVIEGPPSKLLEILCLIIERLL